MLDGFQIVNLYLQKNPQSINDKKAISMKILSTDEEGYNFEFSIVGNNNSSFRGKAVKIN